MTEMTEVKTHITLTKVYFKLFIPEIASVTSVISVARKKTSKRGGTRSATEVTEVTEVNLPITLTKGYFKLLIPKIASVTSVTSVARKKPSKKGLLEALEQDSTIQLLK